MPAPQAAAVLAFLFIRGLLPWALIPVACAWFLVADSGRALSRKPAVRLGETIAWFDVNLAALLTLGRGERFVPWSQATQVKRRVNFIDPL